MTFIMRWQAQLHLSLSEFAQLSVSAPDIDLNHGLLATAILWPIRQPIQEFDGDAMDAVREIVGVEAKHIFKAVQSWGDDPLLSARTLARQAQENVMLGTALTALSQHFKVAELFADQLAQALVKQQGGGDTYNIAGQIKAALVNIGGTTNIQSLTLNLTLTGTTPAKPKPTIPPLPFEPETILIPAGPFLMGSLSDEQVSPWELPPHQVELPAYRIGKYPVTNRQYAEFIKRAFKPEYVPKRGGWVLNEPPAGKLDHPVIGISWLDAKAYCDWLSQETEQSRIYRLPTEAEWEKAASWGEDGSRGAEEQGSRGEGRKRRYPWGDEFEVGRCNGDTAGVGGTTPVSHYSPQGDSAYGCVDMAGNVQEWTSTVWGSDEQQNSYPYPYNGHDGREDSDAGQYLTRVYRVCRGGGFIDAPAQLRCSARGCSDQTMEVTWRGFRVVLEV